MKRDPTVVIRFLLESWSEIVQMNSLPTNKQMRDILDRVAAYPPLMQYYHALSDHGKVFWLDLKAFLESISAALASKNKHELFQSILYHLGLAFKSKEEGVDQDTGKHVTWILFLLCTSSGFKSIVRDGSSLLSRIFAAPDPLTTTLSRPVSAPARPFCPDPMHDTKSVDALEDLLKHESTTIPIPRSELKVGESPRTAVDADADADETSEALASNAPQVSSTPPVGNSHKRRESAAERNVTNQTVETVDYNLPFDPSYYYQNSFPRLLGKEAKEEKILSDQILCWIDRILKDPQLEEYPLKVVKRSQELLYLIRSTTSTAPLSRPYFTEAMSELKMLLESMAPFFLFSVLDSCIEFFTLQVQFDLDLHEIALMTLEFLEKAVTDTEYRHSDQAVYRGSTLIQQWRSIANGKYAKHFGSLVVQVASFVSCLLDDHEIKNLQSLADTLLKDVATESLQGFNTLLLQDAILVILPMLALELHTVSVPLYSTVYKRWTIILQPYSFPTISIIPKQVTVSTNHLFKVGLDHVKSETWKTLSVSLKGISPALLNVSYVICSLKGIHVRDQGILDVQFPLGVDLDFTFAIDEADSCPFEVLDCSVRIPETKITFQKTRFPVMARFVRKKVERRVKKAMEGDLKELLLKSCLAMRKLTRWIRVKLLCWKSSTSSDQEINERIARELTDFLAALGLNEEGGKQQLSDEDTTSSAARTSADEDLQFLPWASRRFSF